MIKRAFFIKLFRIARFFREVKVLETKVSEIIKLEEDEE